MRCDACQALTGQTCIDHVPHNRLVLVDRVPFGTKEWGGARKAIYQCLDDGGLMGREEGSGDPFTVWTNE